VIAAKREVIAAKREVIATSREVIAASREVIAAHREVIAGACRARRTRPKCDRRDLRGDRRWKGQ